MPPQTRAVFTNPRDLLSPLEDLKESYYTGIQIDFPKTMNGLIGFEAVKKPLLMFLFLPNRLLADPDGFGFRIDLSDLFSHKKFLPFFFFFGSDFDII